VNHLEARWLAAIRRHGDGIEGRRVLVACSGGGDSIALLSFLWPGLGQAVQGKRRLAAVYALAFARLSGQGRAEWVLILGTVFLFGFGLVVGMREIAGDVVKQVAGEFIRRRHGDQVGLILFGTQPYLQAPLTADLATAGQFLQDAAVGIAGPQTAIGDAIGLAIKRLRGSDGSTGNLKNTVLILLTDGANDAGLMDPVQAAKVAAQNGLRIYTIGVGAAYHAGYFGGGNSDLDETTLQTIASASGGRYFRATDAEALESVYGEIDRLEPAAGAEQWYRPTTEWFHWPLGLALLLSLPAVLLRGRHDA